MTIQNVKHVVYGRPGRRPSALDVVASRGLLTWWDIMSDLDPGWLEWSGRLNGAESPYGRAA